MARRGVGSGVCVGAVAGRVGMTIRVGKYDMSIFLDSYHRPYCMSGAYDNVESAKYFGYKWYLLFHVLWWEFIITEPC